MNNADQAISSLHSQFWLGVIALCVIVVVPFIKDFWKDRRERRSDEVNQQYLRSIAESNSRLAEGQSRLNSLLAETIAVNTARHSENIQTMKRMCRLPSLEPDTTSFTIAGRKFTDHTNSQSKDQREAGLKEKEKKT